MGSCHPNSCRKLLMVVEDDAALPYDVDVLATNISGIVAYDLVVPDVRRTGDVDPMAAILLHVVPVHLTPSNKRSRDS